MTQYSPISNSLIKFATTTPCPPSLIEAIIAVRNVLGEVNGGESHYQRLAFCLKQWQFPSTKDPSYRIMRWCQHNLHFDEYVRYNDEIFFQDVDLLIRASLSA